MIKDDNNIAIFSCVIVMVAMGMVLQRADGVTKFFDAGSDDIALADDIVNARVNSLVRVDVLSNDVGVTRDETTELQLVNQPACGHAVVRDGAVEFLANAECKGIQRIDYSVRGTSAVATVAAQIVHPIDTASDVAAAPAQPERADGSRAEDGVVADGAGEVALAAMTDDAVIDIASDSDADREPIVPTRVDNADVASGAGANSGETDEAADEIVVAVATERGVEEAIEPTTQSVVAATLAADTVRRSIDVSLARPQVGEIGDIGLAELTGTYAGEPVSAADLANLEVWAGGAEVAKDGSGNFLSALGLGGGDDSDGAGVMMMVIDRDYATVGTPGAPEYGLVGQPAAPRGHDAAKTASSGSDTVTLAVLSAAPAPNAPATVGAALSFKPVDPDEEPYAGQAEALQDEQPQPEITQDLSQKDASQANSSVLLDPSEASAPATASDDIVVAGLPAEPENREQTSAISPAESACVAPPTVSFVPGRAAQTSVRIEAPCQPASVAEISYSGLSLAVALDRDGVGEITVPGFDSYTPAIVDFANGESLDIELSFRDVSRVSRVAITWDAPVQLELNALEFGAEIGADMHVRPANPRGYRDIRKTGGGFLTQHASVAGVGQNVQVYTHLHREGGDTGVVKMMIDFASRSRERAAEACGDGAHAAPMFDVLRVDRGDRARRTRRQLASITCSDAAELDSQSALISGAVEDLLITPR